MRSIRIAVAAVAVAAALAPIAGASAAPCPPGFHEQRFGLFGATWIACLPD